MIDSKGFRAGIAIIIFNHERKLFLAKRIGQEAWQYPQGGMEEDETPEEAMYRELKEEVGLNPEDVELVTVTRQWLYYKLPKHLIRHHSKPLCIGQKQKWFLLKFVGDESNFNFNQSPKPEFDDWAWVDYWHPMKEVIDFKRKVYHKAMKLFNRYVYKRSPRGLLSGGNGQEASSESSSNSEG